MTVRDKRLYKRKVRLRYDTTPDQIRSILDGVRGMLADHPDVDPDPARIRFTKFGGSSLDLDVFAYIKTNDMKRIPGQHRESQPADPGHHCRRRQPPGGSGPYCPG